MFQLLMRFNLSFHLIFACVMRQTLAGGLFETFLRLPFLLADEVEIAREGGKGHELRRALCARFSVRAMRRCRRRSAFGTSVFVLFAKGRANGFECQLPPQGEGMFLLASISGMMSSNLFIPFPARCFLSVAGATHQRVFAVPMFDVQDCAL